MQDYSYENDLCLVMQRLNRRISRAANQALKNTDLTIEQVTLLSVLGSRPSMRAADLSQELELGPSTVSTNIRPLLRRGLIATTDDPDDRRARMLSLTGVGTEALRTAQGILGDMSPCSALEMSEDVRALSRNMNRIFR